MRADPHIVVAGAGAIGCFVGGLLAAAGAQVTLLVRPRVAAEIHTHGLSLTDFDGMAQKISADRLVLTENPACLADADLVLVTVKTDGTAVIAELIDSHAPPKCPVISLQNGVSNAETLRAGLPARDVRAGMVPFNVVPIGQGGYHRATSGSIVIGAGPDDLAEVLTVPYLRVMESREIEAVQWGKFLVNLNNALNALSGLTLREQLRDRAWRRLMADQWAEALAVLRRSGINPASTTSVAVGAVPAIFRLPNPLFKRVATQMLTIDEQARASMSYDLMAGRPTEIDALQGEVMRLGATLGRPTPLSRMIFDLIKTAELAAQGVPNLPASALRAELKGALRH
tara:strand:+ start:186 stop:1211 length:1026 start_codon:yes stop_codon:yes gene_type:complete